MTALAALDLGLVEYNAERVHGHVSRGSAEEQLERLGALPLEERRRVPGLEPERAPVIVAGAVIVREVLARYGLDALEASEHDILHGAALAAAELPELEEGLLLPAPTPAADEIRARCLEHRLVLEAGERRRARRAAEEAGWEALFLWDHLAWVWDGPAVDPWVTLGAVAVRTERLLLGTCVTPVPRRRPQVLAVQVATLDELSGGRAVLGAGIGGNRKEFEEFGESFDTGPPLAAARGGTVPDPRALGGAARAAGDPDLDRRQQRTGASPRSRLRRLDARLDDARRR